MRVPVSSEARESGGSLLKGALRFVDHGPSGSHRHSSGASITALILQTQKQRLGSEMTCPRLHS